MQAIRMTAAVVLALGGATAQETAAQPQCEALDSFELGGLPLGEDSDYFGESIDAQGDIAVVGRPYWPGPVDELGEVWVFQRAGGAWEAIHTLTAGAPRGHFGHQVAIDGDWLAVSAPYYPTEGLLGAVLVYRRDGTSWAHETTLVIDNAAPELDEFGYTLALQGNTLAVQAVAEGPDASHVFVFGHDGSDWIQQAELDEGEGWFGWHLDVSGDLLAVGAGLSVYLYREDSGTWSLELMLENPAIDNFGSSIDLDMNRLAVGAISLSAGEGAVFVYEHDGANWNLETSVESPPGAERYGEGVLLGEGVLIVAAPDHSFACGHEQGDGQVFVYDYSAGNLELLATLTSEDLDPTEHLGHRLALTEDALLVSTHSVGGFGSYCDSSSVFAFHGVADCDDSGELDICEVQGGVSEDINGDGIPDACQCLADLDESGAVDFGDVLAVLAAWGPCTECPEDIDHSDVVDFADLLLVLAMWGPCA